ncbi:MAG: peptidase S41 [Porticoccaceae bacterium]|nr:MAG: peptidase S41 [Porticoccaceae bacterium]
MGRLRTLAAACWLAWLPPVWAEEEKARLPLDELQLFVEVFEQVRAAYVEEVDDYTLFEKAIQGMLAGLDPHSAYLTEDSLADLEETTTGEFGGLGIEVDVQDGFIRVVAPIDDTPAQRAGLKSGDLIIKIDDQSVQGMSLDEAIERMRGEKGTKVRLTILREGRPAPFEVELVRDVIRVQSVRSEVLEERFGYLRIAQFQADTGEQFRREVAKLRRRAKPLAGVILDLRNNPGGLLQSAVEVADALLDEGLIVYTEGRVPSADAEFHATAGDLLEGLPVVAIVNGGTASAAEILAGALQDHRRAVTIGTRTFGKGSVQTVLPLREGKAIKLTTARYFTPAGHSIQAQGIQPDILVQQAEIRTLPEQVEVSEANLPRHLEGSRPAAPPVARDGDLARRLAADGQLYEALNILKGIVLYGGER